METLQGYVEHIIYRNQENGYTVLNLAGEDEEITCTGFFQSLDVGETIEADGDFTVHPSYGRQFKIKSFRITAPKDVLSIERYLGSGAVKGIGEALASRIVKRFGRETLRIMEEEPERLAEVRGISERMAREFAIQIAEKKEQRDAVIFLQKYGISTALSVKIYNAYGAELYGIIRKNPYRLADEMTGVGFKTVDEIARRIGIRMDSDFRIKSGILYILQQGALQGSTYLPEEEVTRQTADLLELEPEAVNRHYMDMSISGRIVLKEKNDEVQVYLSTYYYMEENSAVLLSRLNRRFEADDTDVKKAIEKAEKKSSIRLDKIQAEAVQAAAENGLLVITGGPGTGKTTALNTILEYFRRQGKDFLLAAPTGRAAKRMSEATGCEAKTIHRLLELSGGVEDNAGFERNEDNPLETDVVVIDEMSMVDIRLFYALLKALQPGTRLILAGDVNQLPSVGPGSVLRDIIASGICPTVRLEHIFRQASQSDIIVNAHKINNGEPVTLDNRSRDFFFIKRYDANRIINLCIQLIRDNLPGYVGARPSEIQLLTPMRKGLLGVQRLNRILQQYLNPPEKAKAEKISGSSLFREGDKVMQVRNNYQLEWNVLSRYGIPVEKGVGVFNGDMGIIKRIDSYTERVSVEYEDRRLVEYEFSQLDELELAYAVTIHKSQGSEYPAIVLPLLNGPQMLMNRNLLYTAVTRARKCVVVVGDEKTFQRMIANVRQQTRFCGLEDRIETIMRAGFGGSDT